MQLRKVPKTALRGGLRRSGPGAATHLAGNQARVGSWGMVETRDQDVGRVPGRDGAAPVLRRWRRGRGRLLGWAGLASVDGAPGRN